MADLSKEGDSSKESDPSKENDPVLRLIYDCAQYGGRIEYARFSNTVACVIEEDDY
jgi:hypothetical protein